MELEIACYPLGAFQTNAYLITAKQSRKTWVIDPGFDPEPLLAHIKQHNLNIQRIILTHAHADHIGGLQQLHNEFPDAPISIHPSEKDFLTDPTLNLSAAWPPPVIAPQADEFLEHGDTLELDGTIFNILHTPGHSPGGIILYQRDHSFAIVGDTLFHEGIGRSDFPTSNTELLFKSIREQLMTLPDEVQVLPGHGPATTIAHERIHNPFLNP